MAIIVNRSVTSGDMPIVIPDGAVTTDKLDDGAVTTAKLANTAVTAGKIDFSTFGSGNYSTTETDTGFTWTDGKAIYQRTFEFLALPASGQQVTQAVSGVDTVVDFVGVMRKGADAWKIPYIYASVSYENGNIVITSINADLTTFTATVTLFYTKA